ncbi:MAG: hypothetical protein KHX22_07855 [Clostridiales bacterium]|nr:hypothetical protein [Clostridiales bacterium]
MENSVPFYQNGMVELIADEESSLATPTKSAYPGNYISHSGGTGTIGFNAYYNGKWGVVTNGHIAPSGKSMSCADGTLGTPTFSYIGGKVDVAFIPYPSGWTPTSALKQPNAEIIYREATDSEMIEGGLVTKYGNTTGKTRNGRILSTSVDVACNYGGSIGVKTIKDCFSYTNATEKGDSGGPVGRGKVREVFRLLGINFAKGSDCGFGIKLSNIKSAYPMTVKTGY